MPSVTDEYRTIERLAGWIDRSDRGRLRIEGRDAASFLHALVTNDIQALQPGEGAYAAYLTPQGRMIADFVAYHCGDHVLLDVAPGHGAALAARFDQLVFTEDVHISDVSSLLDQIAVVGAGAEAAIARAAGIELGRLQSLAPRAHFTIGDARVARTDDAPLPSFHLFVPSPDRVKWLDRLDDAGVTPISAELAEALRIETGHPAFGVDMTEETIPLAAGLLDRAISLTKGCYVGQEVIVRVLHRGGGRVAKRLVRLAFEPSLDVAPLPGTTLATDAGDTGRITSAAFSPRAGRVLALGYVHRDAAETGRKLQAAGAPAEILGLAG